jgi:PTS system nitrogen regulatory IIA component
MKLSINQIAHALDLPQGKVERWIRQGRIPLVRHDNTCTFDQQTLARWALQHDLKFSPNRKPQPECMQTDDISLAAALRNGGVHHGVGGKDTAAVFQAAVEQLAIIPEANKPHLVQKLIEREALTSTGIGKGIAIPHPREPESLGVERPAVAACYLQDPIDFKALDGRPVSVMFILLSPSVQMHLQLLSRLSFCLRQAAFIAFLGRQPDETALLSKLNQMERPCEPSDQRRP